MFREVLAIVRSAIFLVIAPGFVAGLVPWWISRWRLETPFFGILFFCLAGGMLIMLGLIASILFPIRGAGCGYAGACLPNPSFSGYRTVSLCPKSDVRVGGKHDSRAKFDPGKRDAP